MPELSKTYKHGTIALEIKIKAECSTEKDIREALSFMAASSHNFYIEMAREFKHKR